MRRLALREHEPLFTIDTRTGEILWEMLIEGFAEALVVGVVVGTYSSIYVAANMLVAMKIDRQDLILPEKEGADQEALI